jgi:hypothetical protein
MMNLRVGGDSKLCRESGKSEEGDGKKKRAIKRRKEKKREKAGGNS